jgi:hypothetical protein
MSSGNSRLNNQRGKRPHMAPPSFAPAPWPWTPKSSSAF